MECELASWMQSDVGSIAEVLENVSQDVHPPGYCFPSEEVGLFSGLS